MLKSNLSEFEDVFINCPYDLDYQPFMFLIIYVTIKFRYNPLFAGEELSSEKRIDKILELIGKTNIGVHDLSKMEAKKVGEVARFNMPFELGLDYGFQQINNNQKKLLILEETKYRYHKAISDLSGLDINAYHKSEKELIKILRDFYTQQNGYSCVPSTEIIHEEFYYEFSVWQLDYFMNLGFTKEKYLEEITIVEYKNSVLRFIESRKKYINE